MWIFNVKAKWMRQSGDIVYWLFANGCYLQEKAHAKKLHEIIQQQIDSTLNSNKTQSNKDLTSAAEVIAQALIQSYAAHAISEQILQSAL